MHRHLAGVLLVVAVTVACVQAADDGNDTAAPPGRACFFEHAPQGSKLSRAPCRAGNRECSQDASDFLNQSCLMPVSTALPPDLWSGRPSRGQQRDCTTCTLSADAADDVDQLRRGLLSSFAAAAEGRVAQEAEGSGITSQESCLVMMGDSMMRQLFTSLVFLVRGAEHVVESDRVALAPQPLGAQRPPVSRLTLLTLFTLPCLTYLTYFTYLTLLTLLTYLLYTKSARGLGRICRLITWGKRRLTLHPNLHAYRPPSCYAIMLTYLPYLAYLTYLFTLY